MAINKTELSFLNQLTSEIIILNEDLKIVWLNYSALNKGWVIDDKNNLITNQLSGILQEFSTMKILNLLIQN